MGSIYVKFGQTISTRPDIVGIVISNELKMLQEKLPPFDTKIAKKQIELSFGKKCEEIFEFFEDIPVAAASIAQVHKARLKNGDIIAVKILRPNIFKQYESEINILSFVSNIISLFFKKVRRLKLQSVLSVFRQSMLYELDLRLEAAAASKMRDNFAGDDMLYLPKIYWDLTVQNIIILEWIDGVSIYEVNEIVRLGYNPQTIIRKIAVIFFNQAYRDGFFHADMHPGNIILRTDGTIAMIDFGIVGILPDQDRLAIAEILYAFFQRDYLLIAKIHREVGYIPQDSDIEMFAQYCRCIAEPMLNVEQGSVLVGNFLGQLFQITEKFGMETQPQLILLQKTMVVVEGIGNIIDPTINMWRLAEPWIRLWAKKNLTLEAKLMKIIKKYLHCNIS